MQAEKQIYNVRYIQRIKLTNKGKPNPFSFGGGLPNGGLSEDLLSKICEFAEFEYMGAAEYEFGKLPRALEKLSEASKGNKLLLKKITIKNNPIYILSEDKLIPEVSLIVKKLGTTKKMEWKLKCPSFFKSVLSGQAHKTVGWIDIENNYMFFTDETLAKNFKALLEKN